jgi:undecaprenyl-diphosphatase
MDQQTLKRGAARALIEMVRRPELPVLLALLALTSLAWGFIALAGEVREGDTQAFDQHVVDALRNPDNPHMPRGPRWLAEAGRDITSLGSAAVLTLMTLAAAGYLALRRQPSAMLLMLLAVISGAAVSGSLKRFFERPRPAVGSALAEVFTSSFPSGHSMLSAVVYLVLGTMLARMECRRAIKIYFIGVAVLLATLVGLSRIYLGVHYPSDVLGGWTAGLAWAIVWWFIARLFKQRKVMGEARPAGEIT